ncbi:hypothetical protein PBY51_014867 [Eleginops maclovinus]|uniref:Uncharacterized protein n=1 Tax=Eleginops maclovinus TaxID=56733 RepID=A0AAN8A7D8_ELEMC|nr:hypothetical protein PBY51_014867 [Eleginops maclovinus]
MSRLTPDPPAKPARLCGTLRPSFENKGEGLTLAIRPLFLDGLQVFQDSLMLLSTGPCPVTGTKKFKPLTHGAVPLGIKRCVTWQKRLSSQLKNTSKRKLFDRSHIPKAHAAGGYEGTGQTKEKPRKRLKKCLPYYF